MIGLWKGAYYMIKLRFCSDTKHDVCAFLEKRFQKDVEKWIEEQCTGLLFDSMDYPCDMAFCYDCYFVCEGAEEQAILQMKQIWCDTALEKEHIFLEIYKINEVWEEEKV